MRISAKIDYACKALLELSLHWPSKDPLQIGTIAKNQNIPIKFLTQILINLKQLGLTQSIRGKNGGYLLAKAPRDIKLSEVIEALGSVGYSEVENRQADDSHIISQIWEEVDKVVLNAMEQITFETIVNRKRSNDKVVMFQI